MVETVLLIDDDKATQYIHKRIINKHTDFKNVLTFLNGEIALSYLNTINVDFIKKPQLILLDLNMPVMDGWDFIEAYNQLDDEIIAHNKLIILTTSSDPEDVLRSKSIRGVSDYVVKPLSEEKLDKILESYFVKL